MTCPIACLRTNWFHAIHLHIETQTLNWFQFC